MFEVPIFYHAQYNHLVEHFEINKFNILRMICLVCVEGRALLQNLPTIVFTRSNGFKACKYMGSCHLQQYYDVYHIQWRQNIKHPGYSVQVDDVTTDTMAVHIYCGETMDNEMCKQLEKVLFTYFPGECSCD